MKQYDSHKDSGIEWIGEIPSHWEVKPIKYLFYYTKGSQGQLLTSSYVQDNPGDYPVYSGQTENNGVLGYYNNYEFDFFNSVIFTTTVGAKFMTTKCLKDKFSLSQNCLIMIPKNDNLISTYHYYFLTIDWKYRRELVPVIIQPSLRMEDIDQFYTLLPPLSEQEHIVSYLDDKTTKIDELIQKKLRKIDLLKEYRTSLINTVVTKGLNPNVPMKDSEIEWIGEIPSHWEVVNGSRIGMYSKGNGIKKDEVTDVGNPCIRYGQIYTSYNHSVNKVISFISDEVSSNSVSVKSGTLLITGSGELKKDIGKCIVYEGDDEVWVGGDIIILKPYDYFNPYYLTYLVNSECIRIQKELNSKGEIIVHIYQKNFYEIHFTLPPLSEQEDIVSYLDDKTSQIDKKIDIEKKKIELLKEYRQSLISNVVTGKIKVTE
jgi:type I restriction enzyme S subunit